MHPGCANLKALVWEQTIVRSHQTESPLLLLLHGTWAPATSDIVACQSYLWEKHILTIPLPKIAVGKYYSLVVTAVPHLKPPIIPFYFDGDFCNCIHHAMTSCGKVRLPRSFLFFRRSRYRITVSEPFFNHRHSRGELTAERARSQAEPTLVRLPTNVGGVWTALGTHAHSTTLCARWPFSVRARGGKPLVQAAGHYCSCWYQGQIWRWDIHLYRLTVLTQRPAVEDEEDVFVFICFFFAGRCCWNVYMPARVLPLLFFIPKSPESQPLHTADEL